MTTVTASVLIENSIEKQREIYIKTSHEIHENPEIGNQEVFASFKLIALLEAAGFSVRKDIAGHATGFIAEKRRGSGPTVAFLAEYDALPGLGHACGHNIIGTTSVAAAIALGEQLEETGGRVVVLGTPAEEGGDNGSAKGSFVREGFLEGSMLLLSFTLLTKRVLLVLLSLLIQLITSFMGNQRMPRVLQNKE